MKEMAPSLASFDIPKMGETCMLCQSAVPIENSHVIPKFAVRWLKENSSPYLRSEIAPNLRKQDVQKFPLLCLGCESRFSKWEDEFSRKIFKPYNANRVATSFAHEAWLIYFVISVSWRVLATTLEHLRVVEPHLYSDSVEAFEQWRLFLLGETQKTNPYDHHIAFFSTIASAPRDTPDSIHAYLFHGLDCNLVNTDSKVRVYTHLPGMALWSAIDPPRMAGWPKGSAIKRKGIVHVEQNVTDDMFGLWVWKQAKSAFSQPLSPKQSAIIDRDMKDFLAKKSPEDVAKIMESRHADLRLKESRRRFE